MKQNYDITVSSDLPYPEICVDQKKECYGKAMLDNVGGENSEMSAIASYIYNHTITGGYDEISYVFHKISVVEMHHLEIFSQLALIHGEDPRLWTNRKRRKVYWSPGYNQYPRDLKLLLINAIKGEYAAIKKYEAQIVQIKDESIVENLKRILLDEKIHINLFQEMYQKYCE